VAPFLFDIDEQAMNQEVIFNRRADKRRSHEEEPSGDSEYAYVVAELRQLRAATTEPLSRRSASLAVA
jgi:hypothetical protein